jgi:hypothetical protein
MRNRGTVMNAGNSPSTWMRKRGTLIKAGPRPTRELRQGPGENSASSQSELQAD